ncbi:MAG: M48 family metallopeptidase [Prolixibacteraceae bacterium]|nr:M48 family metallopeptidase [Prolixibacteraceae bacterium]
MKKILIELIISVALILAVWLGLSKVDWMKLFNIEQVTQNTEEKIGDLFWKMLKSSETEISSDSIVSPVDSMLTRICTANTIDRKKVKLHLLRKDEINAFALPNNHLVIYSGLIAACENEAELYGVIGHELAHMEKNHVMNKLIKEIGLSVLISMTTGNGNAEMIKEAIKHLSSTAYDRSLETEADLTAVDYLEKAGINPEPFANFLYRLADQTKHLPSQIYWISTHPESKERAEEIIKHIKNKDVPKAEAKDSLRFERLKERVK